MSIGISSSYDEPGWSTLYPEGKEETKMKDKIKQAVADEFKYRASQGRTNYSMEEVIYIVNEVIDEVAFENK